MGRSTLKSSRVHSKYLQQLENEYEYKYLCMELYSVQVRVHYCGSYFKHSNQKSYQVLYHLYLNVLKHKYQNNSPHVWLLAAGCVAMVMGYNMYIKLHYIVLFRFSLSTTIPSRKK